MSRLEHVPEGAWDVVRRNFEALGGTFDTGGMSVGVRFGNAVTTYPGGSAVSDNTAVDHGLGKTPVAVFTQSQGIAHAARPTSVGATQFVVNVATLDGSSPGAATDVDVYWLVIG